MYVMEKEFLSILLYKVMDDSVTSNEIIIYLPFLFNVLLKKSGLHGTMLSPMNH